MILLYLESFGNPRRFARLARRIGREKPIVAVKAAAPRPGRGRRAVTRPRSRQTRAVDALFRQSGVIRAETIDEMFDIAACLDAQPLPPARASGSANAGAPGILAVDACEAAGLRVVEFGPRRADSAPCVSALHGEREQSHRHGRVCRARVSTSGDRAPAHGIPRGRADRGVHPGRREQIDQYRRRRSREESPRGPDVGADKPVLACIMSDSTDHLPLRVWSETIPKYAFPENAARALGKVAAYASWRSQPAGLFWTFDDVHVDEARAICRQALARGDAWLTDH